MKQLVFLDRDTLPSRVHLPAPEFAHQWASYGRTALDEVVERCRHADAVFTNKVPLLREQLIQLPKLKYIGVAATGVNVVDLAACKELGITVANVSQYGTVSVAEHSIMLMLMLVRQSLPYQHSLQRGAWQDSHQFCYFLAPITQLSGKRLGIVGTGQIARKVSELAHAFGMNVYYHSPSGRTGGLDAPILSLEELLSTSDLVALHCPLNDTTHHLIGTSELALMKPSAYLINCARGPVLDTQALMRALDHDAIAGAALDVLPDEPPAKEDPLFKAACNMQKLLVTPHIAWASDEAMRTLAEQLIQKVNDFFAGRPLQDLAQ